MATDAATTRPPTARARARAELTREIKDVARRQMAEQGAAALSLRAVARELGMVSSAVYRYFPSRDDLLTALIVDAYDAVADAAEASQASLTRAAGTTTRWLALAGAVRDWALAHRSDFDLIYGSPVPGYQAPVATTVPVERLSAVLLRVLAEGYAAGEVVTDASTSIPRATHADFGSIRAFAGTDLPDAVISRGLLVWTQLFGTLSFELHGHLHNAITDYDAFFDLQMRRAALVLVTGA
jgi:AcrR family transcriptional regulator